MVLLFISKQLNLFDDMFVLITSGDKIIKHNDVI